MLVYQHITRARICVSGAAIDCSHELIKRTIPLEQPEVNNSDGSWLTTFVLTIVMTPSGTKTATGCLMSYPT